MPPSATPPNASFAAISRFRPFYNLTLLQQFMLMSGVILLVGAGVIGWWIDRQIVREVTNATLQVATIFVDSTIAPHVWELKNVDNISESERTHLNQLLNNSIRSDEFAAFNIWKPDGTLVYSSAGDIQEPTTDAYGLAAAVAGMTYSARTQHIHGQTQDTGETYLETYFPVRAENGDEIIAVVAFYQRLAGLNEALLLARLQSWLVVGVATVLMYLVLFNVMKRGNDTITQQQHDLAQSRWQIQQAAVRAAALNEASMRRLGSDLHDGPAQDLGIALMRMEPLRAAIETRAANPQSDTEEDMDAILFDLQLIHTALQSSLQEIRNTAAGLRLPELSELDIAGVIHRAVLDYQRKTGRDVSIEGPEPLVGDEALKSVVYRIVQETLNNGHAHGNPTRQWVRYEAVGNRLVLEVGDDGRGMDVSRLYQPGGRRQLGLAGLQERVEILAGGMEIDSRPGAGTRVRVNLPLFGPKQEGLDYG